MRVVPTFTKGQQRHHPVVGAEIVTVERSLSVEMADGIDAPGDVMEEEDPHCCSPNEGAQRSGKCSGNRKADRGGNSQRKNYPHWEEIADDHHRPVLLHVRSEFWNVRPLAIEEPSDVGMPQSQQDTLGAFGFLEMWRMWIARFVGKSMMTSVIGNP